MKKSEKGEVRAGIKISSVLPGLSFRWWLSIQDVTQAGRDSGRDLCIRWGKGEKELGIFSIAVVGHAMSREDRAKRPSVHREEEGTED